MQTAPAPPTATDTANASVMSVDPEKTEELEDSASTTPLPEKQPEEPGEEQKLSRKNTLLIVLSLCVSLNLGKTERKDGN